MKLSVIIPVYNERVTIGEIIERVKNVDLGEIQKEIILSDDGSTDGSREFLEKISKNDPLLHLHRSIINMGKGAAIRFGLKYATGDIIIIQDADLELDPNEYPLLLAPILDGQADVVYGSRFKEKKMGIPRRTLIANKFLVWMTNLLYGGNLTDMETAYKVFKSSVILNIKLSCVGFDFEPEITAKLLKAGYQIWEVPISYHPRSVDGGKKIGWKDGVNAVYTLLKYKFFA